MTLGLVAIVAVSWLSVAAFPGSAAARTVLVEPGRLPMSLASGWEVADGDPVDGVAGLDGLSWRPADPVAEPGPQGAVRWYRLRLDLTACRGMPLALEAVRIRDADEAYLDGTRIGGAGDFPPRRRPAAMQVRIYPFPTHLVDQPGVRVLALRVYHAPSSSSVFPASPVVAALAVTRSRWRIDLILTILVVAGVAMFAALATSYLLDPRRKPVLLASAGFVLFESLYLASAHSVWSLFPSQPSLPFRLAACSGGVVCAIYSWAISELMGLRLPRRFVVYNGVFLAYAAAALLVPDVSWMIGATTLARVLIFVCLAELAVCSWRQGGRRAAAGLLAHAMFAASVVWLNLVLGPDHWYRLLSVVCLLVLAFGTYWFLRRQIESRQRAVSSERRRLAREVHDRVAPGLTGISLHLDAALSALAESPGEARRMLDTARSLARSTLADSRRFVQDLRAAPLGSGDLARALQLLAEGVASSTPIRVATAVHGLPRRLPGAVEYGLFRIGQEAVANAVKHSGAGRIDVRLEYGPGSVGLLVRDNGCGLGASDTDADGTRLGLIGMAERARQLAGRLELRSAPGKGTEVVAELTTDLPSHGWGGPGAPALARPDAAGKQRLS